MSLDVTRRQGTIQVWNTQVNGYGALALTNIWVFAQPADLILVFVCQPECSVFVFALGEPVGLHNGRKDWEPIPCVQRGIIGVGINA